ncbi:MAG: AMIN domain-containing protein [Aliarcobacter sp.]|nr:AMIN domain-containing protein [Aliarcobacter sp.]
MKTLFLFTLTIILSTNLTARENPFAITNAYEEAAAKIIELNETPATVESIQEAQYIKEMQEKMSNTTSIQQSSDVNKNKVEDAVKRIVPLIKDGPTPPKTYSKKEVDSMIQNTKKVTEQKTKEIVKKELSKTQNIEPTQVVYVKPRADVIEEDELVSKKLLSFLKIEFNDNKLIIHTDYKVSKKFSVTKENKIIIDYKAKINFLTLRDDIESKNFKKIAIGNHKTEGYFRVAIELIDKPSKYNVTYENNLITISKIN